MFALAIPALTALWVLTEYSGGETAVKVAELLSRGMTQGAIAGEVGRAKATVNYHARRLGVEGPAHYVGRAFVVRVLGYSGVRNSELCDLRIRHVRLHDPGGARFHVPDSKTRPASGSWR